MKIMKILIFDWAYECKKKLKTLGYEHKQEIEKSWDDLQDVIHELLDSGMSVMIEKPASDHDYVIFVDKNGKRFKQR
jgi:hypothetical protein